MKKGILIGKGILFGIFGAIIGAVPNAILKFLLYFSKVGNFCLGIIYPIDMWELGITPCGIVFSPYPLWKLFLTPILLIGGALFGFLGMLWGYKIAQKKGTSIGPRGWKNSFWWSFLGGVSYDLIFLFPIIYLTQ